jgi:hypothetical protein
LLYSYIHVPVVLFQKIQLCQHVYNKSNFPLQKNKSLMSSSRITNKANLSLAYFVVRSQSLLFYREILKTIRRLDPNIAQEVKKEVCTLHEYTYIRTHIHTYIHKMDSKSHVVCFYACWKTTFTHNSIYEYIYIYIYTCTYTYSNLYRQE